MIVQTLAPSAPATRAGQLFDATAQPMEAYHAGLASQLTPQLVAQPGKEKQFATAAGIKSELAQVRLEHTRFGLKLFGKLGGESESVQHLFQRLGEFTHRHGEPPEIILEIMEDRIGGVLDKMRIEFARAIAA